MATIRRTPPDNKIKTNITKRVRSDDELDASSNALSLETVVRMMNSQFEKTLERIEEMNKNISDKIDTVKAELDEKLDAVSRDVSSFKAECADQFARNDK